jgi:hypothetical protein
MENIENIEAQKEFLSKMLKLIPDLESNGPAISSIVSMYSDMETYDILTKNIILTSRDGLKITFALDNYIEYLHNSIESLEIRLRRRQEKKLVSESGL